MNIGLVISGGVAKGAYQVGFLRALSEEIKHTSIKVSGVSCSSIGIFSGYAYAADKMDALYDIWNKVHFDSTVDLMYNVWFKHFLKDAISDLVKENDLLNIPMYAPICYFPFLHMDYFRLYGNYYKKWPRFILGAVSFPFLSGGIHWFKGQISFDGGTMDNIPILPLLLDEKPDLILVLHFEAGFKPRRKYLDYGIPIIDFDISIDSVLRKYTFDFHHEINLRRMEDGYKYGKQICSFLFDKGKRSLNDILAVANEQKEKEFIKRLSNTTLETWVQRLNEIFYPFISRTRIKICNLSERKKEKKASYAEEKILVDDKM